MSRFDAAHSRRQSTPFPAKVKQNLSAGALSPHRRPSAVLPATQVLGRDLVAKRGVNEGAAERLLEINLGFIHKINSSLFSLVTSSSTSSFLPG